MLFLLGLVVGSCFGVIVSSLCIISKRQDEADSNKCNCCKENCKE